MSTKVYKVAGEVDSWCTSCRLLLNHRIISIFQGKPKQVECLTCRKAHLFRPLAPGEKAASAAKTPRTAKPTAATRLDMARVDHERTWEKAVAGRSPSDFRSYRVSEMFREGELIRHSRFGDGFVLRVVDAQKVEILFKEELKTLAQGLVD